MKYLKYSLSAILSIAIVGTSLLVYKWSDALYRVLHVTATMSGDVPEWVSSSRYEIDVTVLSLDEIRVTELNYPVNSSIHIYRPITDRQTSFMMFIPGFTPHGASDKRIVGLATSMAETGIGVAVPDTEYMRSAVFSPLDINAIKTAFYYLEQQDYVKDGMIAIGGFSAAGSYALITAALLGEKPLFILTFGGYYNLSDLIASVISNEAVYKGQTREWNPGRNPVDIVSNMLGSEMIDISENTDFQQALELLNNLDNEMKETLEMLSPSSIVHKIKSPVFILHSAIDDSIPVEESYRLADSIPQDTNYRFTEFKGFSHVTPRTVFSLDYLRLSHKILFVMKELE